jgi:hypothetical protein
MEFNVRSLKTPVTRSEEGGGITTKSRRYRVKEGPTVGGLSMAQEEGGAAAMARRRMRRRRRGRRLG